MGFFRRFRKSEEQKSTAAQHSTSTPAPKRDEPEESTMQPMPQVKEMPVEELRAKLDRGETPLIIDVRETWEYDIVHLAQAKLIPMNTIPQKMQELDKNAEIVVHCHHGNRSWNVAAYLMQNGFTSVQNLTGGIDAWARRIERTMKTY